VNHELKRYSDVEWTKDIDALIGTVPDRVVSERYGIAVRSVRKRRQHLKKKSKDLPHTDPPRWTNKLDKRLGTMRDSELAKQIVTTSYHVRTRRYELDIPPFTG
jgi:hypothetical protein